MKTITQAKPKKKLSAFFDQFTDKDIKAEINEAAEKESNLVSAVIRSAYSRDSLKTSDELAQFEADAFHEVLNRFIADGITFDVSADDFQTIDGANLVKTEIEKLIDRDAWDSALEREHHERQLLEKISRDLTQAEN
jgi:FtsZ-binding cell division protein ZapB